jgi:hypothetical protein
MCKKKEEENFYSLRTVVDKHINTLPAPHGRTVLFKQTVFCRIYSTIGANSYIHCFYFLAVGYCTFFFSRFLLLLFLSFLRVYDPFWFVFSPFFFLIKSCGICQFIYFLKILFMLPNLRRETKKLYMEESLDCL